MPVPRHRDIRIGTPVSIVLKADQRTGRQVQGTVSQLLTRGDHSRGVKVRLSDGRVGRVQQLAAIPAQTSTFNSNTRYPTMDPEHNPWASTPSQGYPHSSQQGGFQPQGHWGQPGQQQAQQRQQAQPLDNTQNQRYYDNNNNNNQTHQTPAPAPSRRIQRSDTDALLAQQPDGAEQVEYLQNFEASAKQTKDDKDQAQLQKEFPDIDSSLIAALYSDTKDLAATREMLQELARA